MKKKLIIIICIILLGAFLAVKFYLKYLDYKIYVPDYNNVENIKIIKIKESGIKKVDISNKYIIKNLISSIDAKRTRPESLNDSQLVAVLDIEEKEDSYMISIYEKEGRYFARTSTYWSSWEIDKKIYYKILDAQEKNRIRIVKTDDYTLYDTGIKLDKDRFERSSSNDKIISTVSPWERPREQRQSNFGDGYEYRFTDKNQIAVYIDDEWHLFEIGDWISYIEFNGKKYITSFLTEQTIEWIYEYNLLSKEEKEKAMKDIPIQLKIEDFVLKE